MTSLAWSPVDDDTADLLALVADPHTVTRKPLADAFREACWAEAQAHNGWVSPNLVSARLHAADPDLNPRQLSALWCSASGSNGFLDKTEHEAQIDPTHSRGNGNKGVRLRRWREGAPRTLPTALGKSRES